MAARMVKQANSQRTLFAKLPFRRVLLLFLQIFLVPAISHAAEGSGISTDFSSLIENGSYMVEKTKPSLKHRENDLFIPASTIKILTSLAALEYLGTDYRFETHFFLDSGNNMMVKGFGDPFLISEKVASIARRLKKLGVNQVNSLLLDTSSFDLGAVTASNGVSDNPYDAPNGALGVNFNSLPIKVFQDSTIGSGEPQTPLLPIMAAIGSPLPPGVHRVNINAVNNRSRIPPHIQYTAELFSAMMLKEGITVRDDYRVGRVPKGLLPLLIYENDIHLSEIVRACLKFSNNFIANQLFLTCGANRFGLPATWKKSRKFMTEYLEKKTQLLPHQIRIKEGSGISRENRISSTAMMRILENFKPYAHLLPQRNSVLLKSGTLHGVHCYAGYFQNNASLTGFTIFLNQPQNRRDKLLDVLHSQFLMQTP